MIPVGRAWWFDYKTNPLSHGYFTWWRHQMETFSALLAICAGNSPVPGEFPTQRLVTRSFDIFFDVHPNKRLSKQWWGWWFETPSCPLWRHRNERIEPIPTKWVPRAWRQHLILHYLFHSLRHLWVKWIFIQQLFLHISANFHSRQSTTSAVPKKYCPNDCHPAFT